MHFVNGKHAVRKIHGRDYIEVRGSFFSQEFSFTLSISLIHCTRSPSWEQRCFSIVEEHTEHPHADGTLMRGAYSGCAIFLQGTGNQFFPANTPTARYHPPLQTAFELAVKSGVCLQYRQSWILSLSTVAVFNSTVKSEE